MTPQNLEYRFSKFIDRGPHPKGCWLFTGYKFPNGYGNFIIIGFGCYAHRASYLIFNGPFLRDLQVLHSCDVRACVNPDHLFLGDQQDNITDMMKKGRHWTNTRPDACVKGERCHKAKLKSFQIPEIRKLLAEGKTYPEVGKIFGVDATTIYHIRVGNTWKSVLG